MSEKATDKLTSWIRHLFACAAGENGERYCVARSKKDKLTTVAFPQMPQSVACAALQTLLAIYVYGQSAVPLFAPATSYGFAAGLRKKVKKDTPAEEAEKIRRAAASKAASKAWYTAYKARGDDDNDHFRMAFGKDGPVVMDEEGFAHLAKQIFDPMLDAMAPKKEKKAND